MQVTGAPWLASVSYAGTIAVVAVHPRVHRAGFVPTGLGIDAEPLEDAVRNAAGGAPGGLLRWVRTEAALKADGRGLRIDPAHVEIAETIDGWRARVPGRDCPVTGVEPAPSAERALAPGVLLSVALAWTPEGEAGRDCPTTP